MRIDSVWNYSLDFLTEGNTLLGTRCKEQARRTEELLFMGSKSFIICFLDKTLELRRMEGDYLLFVVDAMRPATRERSQDTREVTFLRVRQFDGRLRSYVKRISLLIIMSKVIAILSLQRV